MKIYTTFDAEATQAFEPEAKVGLLATVNPAGLPHITLITALQAKSPEQMMWGQFTEGRSKAHVRSNPKTGFLILTMDRRLWRGKAVWTHAVNEGADYVMFNSKPMFRYNAYFGIHTVHYMDLVGTYGRENLPLGAIVASSLM
ncbi:MAG: pyridoxamine 5'-phosphate oxidase family protein, partial [Syntrophaceae bacterium]